MVSDIFHADELGCMMLPLGPGIVGEVGDVLEVADAVIRVPGAKVTGVEHHVYANSVSYVLPLACNYGLVCCFSGG